MRRYFRILSFAAVLLVSLALAACFEEHYYGDVDITAADTDIFLRLQISTMAQTRAELHPFGGNDGDGREAGRANENSITDITLFIYNGDGINDNGTTPIKYSKYFCNISYPLVDGEFTTEPVKISGYQPVSGDRIIVFANMGDMHTLATLDDVRNAAVGNAWMSGSDIMHYGHFAMSSAADDNVLGVVRFDGKTGTVNDPFTAETIIERVAARFDIWLIKQAAQVGDPIDYETLDGLGTLKLSHIRTVNSSQEIAYALKRVSDNVFPLKSWKYLGDEEVLAGTHIPANYVVEPTTHLKHYDYTVTDEDMSDWYGESSLAKSLSTDFLASDNYKVHACKSDTLVFTSSEESDIDGDGNPEGTIYCYTLAYSMENTMDVTGQDIHFMPGLALKGTFVPNNIYKMTGSELETDNDYKAGDDIWLYATHSDTLFFSSENAAKAYKTATGQYAKIVYYSKGECYYYVWVRHAMSDSSHPSGTYPMEYATVRNNIYRIGVKAVSKIGTPYPDPGLTPQDPEIQACIFVRDWRFRQEKEIVM